MYTTQPIQVKSQPSVLSIRTEVNRHTVDTVSLILRVTEPLALEDMSQVSPTVIANNLRPHHSKTGVRLLSHSARYGIPERGPPAARVELVVCLVEGRFATGALVDAGVGVVLVEFAGAGHFGAFLTEDAELLYRGVSDYALMIGTVIVPGDSCACHSPSGFWTG